MEQTEFKHIHGRGVWLCNECTTLRDAFRTCLVPYLVYHRYQERYNNQVRYTLKSIRPGGDGKYEGTNAVLTVHV